MPEKRERPRDLYYDCFAAQFQARYGLPYVSTTADWVNLRGLQRGPLAPHVDLLTWERAVFNYFASERGEHSLKYLCSKFAALRLYPLDRYSQPLRRNGGYMRSTNNIAGLPWPIGFLRRINALGDKEPGKRPALESLLDEVESEHLSEIEATKRLDVIEGEPL